MPRYEPEDFIVALLAKFRERQLDRFEADPVSLHPAFYAWRTSPEYKKYLALFTFDTRDYFPFSDTLEEVLDSLQFSGYLERTNPRGTWYQVTPALEALFVREIASKFDPADLKVIDALAASFAASVRSQPARPAAAS